MFFITLMFIHNSFEPAKDLYYVFTDIEGSSSLWETLPSAMADALSKYCLLHFVLPSKFTQLQNCTM